MNEDRECEYRKDERDMRDAGFKQVRDVLGVTHWIRDYEDAV